MNEYMKNLGLYSVCFFILMLSAGLPLYATKADTPPMPTTAEEISRVLGGQNPILHSERHDSSPTRKRRGVKGIADDPVEYSSSLAPRSDPPQYSPPLTPKSDPVQYSSSLAPASCKELKKLRTAAALINFDYDSARLPVAAYRLLNEYAVALRGDIRDVVIVIAGHTDSKGPANYNWNLAHRRAQAVKDHLVTLGIESNRLILQSCGEDYPIATNSTKEGRRLNRRTEFVRVGTL